MKLNGRELKLHNLINTLNQGLSDHQEVCFTPVTKVKQIFVIFWDFLGAI